MSHGGARQPLKHQKVCLAAVRKGFNISEQQHNEALRHAGWTTQMYESGHGVVNRRSRVLSFFRNIVSGICHDLVITEAERTLVSSYQLLYDISDLELELCLGMQGWSLGDFERGMHEGHVRFAPLRWLCPKPLHSKEDAEGNHHHVNGSSVPLHTYKKILGSVLTDGLDPQNQLMLAMFRVAVGVTEDQHEQCLDELGYVQDLW